MTIGLLLIATRKYKSFVQNLLNDVKKYFFIYHNIEVHLFIDETEHEFMGDERVKIIKDLIPSYTFPNATLLRYHIFTSKKYDCDYLFYSDVDMSIVDYIDESILSNIVAVRHPGFDKIGGGSWETNELSMTYVYPEKRISYYAGGFQGGKKEYYYRAMQSMRMAIDEDEKNGIVPIWHDESAWNCFLSGCDFFKELGSEYCMPDREELQRLWKIDKLPKRILALSKDHENIRT